MLRIFPYKGYKNVSLVDKILFNIAANLSTKKSFSSPTLSKEFKLFLIKIITQILLTRLVFKHFISLNESKFIVDPLSNQLLNIEYFRSMTNFSPC
jgi:hypothetical protein